MRLIFTPQRSDETLVLEKSGDVLMINGQLFDFTRLAEGEVLPVDAVDSPWVIGDVSRANSELQLMLLLPLGANASDAARFPQPLQVQGDGPVELPQ